jgi:glucosamine kinase
MDERVTQLVSAFGHIQPLACCAGAAGAEVPEANARLAALLRRLLPGSRVCVVHDARLVLAAAGLDAGIALIAGTGSVAYGRTADGREAQRGGWGWMIGDEGSGVWITREAARLVMARTENGDTIGELGRALLTATGASSTLELVRDLHGRREPRRWAELSGLVFEAAGHDDGALEIVRRAAAELARLVAGISQGLGIEGPVVIAGGLLLHHLELEHAVRQQLGRDCIRLEQPPVEGAVRLAEELLRA